MNGTDVLGRQTPECQLVPSSLRGRSEKTAIDDFSGDVGSHQTRTQLVPLSWTWPPELWEIISLVLKPLSHETLWQQPEQSKNRQIVSKVLMV